MTKAGFLLGFSAGCFAALGLHYFIRCEQADLGHPRVVITEGKTGDTK